MSGRTDKSSPLVYPLLHNGPVYYFALLAREKEITLEQHDNYVKQSYRNRCRILGPNGVVDLTVPIKRKRGTRTPVRDVRVDYDSFWNRIHWKSLIAAYASSPYFEYLADDLRPFYEKKIRFLVDLNAVLTECVFRLLDWKLTFSLSEEFVKIGGEEDPRQLIHPKKDPGSADPRFRPEPYHQVFSEKHGFRPNLSILDLMFNAGPESLSILRLSLRT